MKILSTKILSDEQLDALHAAKMQVDVCKVIDIVPLESPVLNDIITDIASQPVNVILTSQHAVQLLKSLYDTPPSDWQVYCVNGATQTMIESWLGTAVIHGAAKDAKHLIPHLEQMNAQLPTYFFGAAIHSNVIPLFFEEKGWTMHDIHLYDILPIPCKVNGNYDIYLFFSPSGVDAFLQYNTLPLDACIVTIGDTTQQYLIHKNYQKVNAADQPTIPAMIDTIRKICN